MNIHIVRNNLKNTIAGKQELVTQYRTAAAQHGRNQAFRSAISMATNMLETNLDELNKILADVEICCEQAAEAGWAANPDRMGQ